jgi:hypothetical protein
MDARGPRCSHFEAADRRLSGPHCYLVAWGISDGLLGVGLTRWNDLHPGFSRQNRPRPPAGGGFEADLGTARGRLCREAS